MSAETSKLQAVQQRLVEQGVVDVKFFFAAGVEQRPFDEMKDNLAAVLNAYCDGKFVAHQAVGDIAFAA